MKAPSLPLSLLPVGKTATVEQLLTKGDMRRRFLDLGITQGSEITCLGRSPAKDPSAYLIRGTVIAIRAVDSRTVLIRLKEKEVPPCAP